MIIDCHSHLYPPKFRGKGDLPEIMFDVDGLLNEQDRSGVDMTVVSNPMFYVSGSKIDLTSPENCKVYNAFVANICAKHPKRLVAIAAGNPFAGDEMLKEVERTVKDYGLRGVSVNSSVAGKYLDSPDAFPFFDLVSGLGVPVFIHPPGEPLGTEKMRDFEVLLAVVGRLWDTTLTVYRMILSGVLERFPKLRIVAAHVGGAIPMIPRRIDYGLGYEVATPHHLTRAPSSYLSQVYVDTVSFHPPAVRCAVETLGADHVVLGSDFPPMGFPLSESVKAVTGAALSKTDEQKVLGGNARSLYRIS